MLVDQLLAELLSNRSIINPKRAVESKLIQTDTQLIQSVNRPVPTFKRIQTDTQLIQSVNRPVPTSKRIQTDTKRIRKLKRTSPII